MTTIIVVVVVALVFFVSVCVATFMIWKREEEMRTDSLRSIEANLQELGYRMTGNFSHQARRTIGYVEEPESRGPAVRGQRTSDPFDWTREPIAPSAGIEPEAIQESRASAPLEQSEVNVARSIGIITGEVPREAAVTADRTSQYPGDMLRDAPDVSWGDNAPNAKVSQDAPAFDADERSTSLPFEEEDLNLDDFYVSDDMLYDSYGITPEDFERYDLEEFEDEFGDDLDLDFEDESVPGDMDGYIADYSADSMTDPREPMVFDVGRSGRRYTAEELDMLIKE